MLQLQSSILFCLLISFFNFYLSVRLSIYLSILFICLSVCLIYICIRLWLSSLVYFVLLFSSLSFSIFRSFQYVFFFFCVNVSIYIHIYICMFSHCWYFRDYYWKIDEWDLRDICTMFFFRYCLFSCYILLLLFFFFYGFSMDFLLDLFNLFMSFHSPRPTKLEINN